jgi:amino acid transporter/nitrogen regulatory protein PII
MAKTEQQALVNRVLDWKGAATNAMALIAPGAFLWITYQAQSSLADPSGASCANDMWAGIILATALCFFTAFSYAELAKIYPEAGFAGAVYFAEKAFIDDQKVKRAGPTSFARVAKLITGWAAHLFYWVYPGVMVATFGNLVSYLYGVVTNGGTLPMAWEMAIIWAFTFLVGFIAYKGVQGSTKANYWGNIIQWVTIAIFGVLAIMYRLNNPEHATSWAFSGGLDIVKWHSIKGVLIQSTVAILILVGFESSTSLSAETKEPEKNIPKAIIVALVVQCLIAYTFEYFAANLVVNEKFTQSVPVPAVAAVAAQPMSITSAGVTIPAVAAVAAQPATTKIVTGMDAMGASSAPIGDMVTHIGNSLLGGIGSWLLWIMAATVVIAVIGTTLACINTAVRVTNGMAEDRELPNFLGFIHRQNASPHTAIWLLVVVSCIIGAVGIQSVVGFTGITVSSNLGTFVLYGAVCIWTFIAYKKRKDFSVVKHALIPLLGLILNAIMCWGILYLYTIGNADSQNEVKICFYIAGGWAMLWGLYVVATSALKSHGMKTITAIIRPDSLEVLAEALNKERLVQGMTVTEVRGFGRTKGSKTDDEPAKVKFLPKLKVEIVVNEWDIPHVVEVVQDTLSTGTKGDGKIFVSRTDEAIRVSTGETGVVAV